MKCSIAQDWMVAHYKDKAIVALRYFYDKEVPRMANDSFDSKIDKEVLDHLRSCESCKNWVSMYSGVQLMERQRKLSQYCCPQMFGASEEPKKIRIQISYTPDSGMRWFVNGQTMINYCPWCGAQLPSQPFVQS